MARGAEEFGAGKGGAWKVTQIAPMPYPLGAPTAR